jgi:hypothetical protein
MRTLQDELIEKYLKVFSENNLLSASLQHFSQTGQASGSFRIALHELMDEYAKRQYKEELSRLKGELAYEIEVREELWKEVVYLLHKYQSESCPQWIEGVGDCNKSDCEFCRLQRCIDAVETLHPRRVNQ